MLLTKHSRPEAEPRPHVSDSPAGRAQVAHSASRRDVAQRFSEPTCDSLHRGTHSPAQVLSVSWSLSKLSTPLRPQAQPGPTRHPHSRLFLVTLPGQGALWRQALPRRSRNTTAAVRERNAQRQCLSRHSSEHGGRKTRRTAQAKASPGPRPQVESAVPPGPAASPLRCREAPADRLGKPLGVPPPHAQTRWPLAAPRLPPRCTEQQASLGFPPGIPLFGALGRDRARWSTGRQGPGFPSWDKLKVSTHELWDLRKTTLILQPAVT